MDILLLKVSVTAMEDSRVLLWHRDKLKLSIITDQFLQAVFDHILGRDVVKKLMQVSRHFAKSNNMLNKKVKRVILLIFTMLIFVFQISIKEQEMLI